MGKTSEWTPTPLRLLKRSSGGTTPCRIADLVIPHWIDPSSTAKTNIPHKGLPDSLSYGIGSRFLERQPVPSTRGTINPWRSLRCSTSGSLPMSL
jgi:hypothetical protein